MRHQLLFPFVVSALLLSGCGGGSSAINASGPEEQPSAVTTVTQTPIESEGAQRDADFRDYEDLAFEEERRINEWMNDWEQSGCEYATQPDLLCNMKMVSASLKSQTVVAVFEGARTPDAPAYIGDLSNEEQQWLVDSTIEKAESVQEEADKMEGNDCTNQPVVCDLVVLQTVNAMKDLETKLSSWQKR